MVLQAATAQELATAKANGATHALVQAVWDQLQTVSGGTVNAQPVADAIGRAKAAGLEVCLEVALQYPPAFVTAGVPKFQNQAGAQWSGGQGSGDDIRDWVWSQVGRSFVGDFLTKLFAQIPWAGVDRVRLGGLQKGELQFPGDGQSPQWWCFSAPAQTGVGLAGGMSAAPTAARVPSTGTTWTDDDVIFYAWYRQSMNNWLAWLIAQHRRYFDGPIWVMHPGAGLRSVSQTPTSAGQGTNWRINASKGLDWDAQMAAYPDAQVWPYSTWADGTHFWPPAWADDVNDGNAAAWYHLLRVSKKYGRAGRIWGENTGGQSNADMDRVFRSGAVAYGYQGMAWMSHSSLASGTDDTYANFSARVAEVRA